ncbi:dermonecrotic toxin domain-containing protein [Pseudomonas sp. B22129]|uniref:dermonecrotic toxin domain-containing protein n=1 Tax=Pseudomonas sp. B22129 TaxID=3235111 RepID=UPI003784057B
MPHDATHTPSIETHQRVYLAQLLECQKALEALLSALPEAGKTLVSLLHLKVQASFPGHPLPIALDQVRCEEHIELSHASGSTQVHVERTPARTLSALFNDKPWGGPDFEAPNRRYRYCAKTTYRVKSSDTERPMRTVHHTTYSTRAFEAFIDTLIRKPYSAYQQQLDEFWREPVEPGNPTRRSQQLAHLLRRVLQSEAALRVEDQTLEQPHKTLIDQISRHPTRRSRAHLPAEQRPSALAMCLEGQDQAADIRFAGVFIATGKTLPADITPYSDVGAVALFIPGEGIHAFDSLQALDQALRSRFGETTPSDSLLATVRWQDQARAHHYFKAAPRLCYRPIPGNIFEYCALALLTLQKHDIRYGWYQMPLHETDTGQVNALFNRLAHIGSLLDVRGILLERAKRYVYASLPAWYLNASAVHKQALDRLTHAEWTANQALAAHVRGVSIPALSVFAHDELVKQLAIDHPGKRVDPNTITVTLTRSLNPASLGGGVGADQVPNFEPGQTQPRQTITLSLTELALRNLPPWDFSLFNVFTGEVTAMSASGKTADGDAVSFDQPYLKSLVQKLDVSKAYDQLLQSQLIDQGATLRRAWADAHRASMACAALAARLDTGSLLEDREQRGYQWIDALIEGSSPTNRRTVEGHAVVASSLMIGNSPNTRNGFELNGVVIISVQNHKSVPNVILYTPGAPTAQAFKEFSDRAAMQAFLKQQWATSPAWQHYVMQQLSAPGQAALTESPLSGTVLLEDLVRNARSRIANPFETVHVTVIDRPLHEALYEQKVFTLRRNADHGSTSNAEVQEQAFWNKLMLGVELAFELIELLPLMVFFRTLNNIRHVFLLLKQTGASASRAKALWSITGARGLVRANPTLGAFPAIQPAVNLSGLEVEVGTQAMMPIEGNLLQSTSSAQQYVAIGGKHYLSDVAQGQRFIYPPSVGGKTLRYPLTLDSTLGHWIAEPMPRLRGGMDPIEKGPYHTTYRDYALPPADHAELPTTLNLQPVRALVLSPSILTQNQATMTSMLHLFAIQTRLRRHARYFMNRFTRPDRLIVLPPPDLSPGLLFNQLYNQRPGVIIGESHLSGIERRVLFENIPVLRELGVRKFFFEMFITDIHQSHLDLFNASASAALPSILSERIELVDTINSAPGVHTYRQLVDEIHANGLQVMALDISASALYVPGALDAPGTASGLPAQLDRLTMFNFFAYKKINADVPSLPQERWLALIGSGHCNSLQGIPGVAELTGAISLRVTSRVPALPVRVWADPGAMVPSIPPLMLKSDLLLRVTGPDAQRPFTLRIHAPHQFLFTNPAPERFFVHFMDEDRRIIDVPVVMEGTQVHVTHDRFNSLSNRRFISLSALADALTDELHMIEV